MNRMAKDVNNLQRKKVEPSARKKDKRFPATSCKPPESYVIFACFVCFTLIAFLSFVILIRILIVINNVAKHQIPQDKILTIMIKQGT